jgi:hypothetical protein
MIASAAVCGILLFASWLERDLPNNTIFDWKEYRDVWRALRTIANGNVMFVGIVVEAALLGFALLFFLGLQLKWNAIATMSANVRFIALNAWWAVAVLIGAVVVLAFLFRDYFRWVFKRYGSSRPFAWSEMVLVGRSLREVVRGPNLKAFLVLEGVLVVVAAVPALGSLAGWAAIAGLSDKVRLLLMLLWVLIPVGLVAFGAVVRLTGLSRASLTVVGAGAAAAILSFAYYPALAAQLSPREVFESYAKLGGTGEPLALLGVSSRTASYYARGEVQTFNDVDSALNWLLHGGERRWLLLRDEDLARLNSSYRSRTRAGQNLPILDARSSRILLASSRVDESEQSHNPLDEIVLGQRPVPSRPLDVELEGQLKTIGWDIVDPAGRLVQTVTAGRQYRLRLYHEVIGRIARDWKSFIHIDGHRRRFNGDHDPMGDKYPMTLWQVGDCLVDDYSFALEPNFTPGDYTMFYGFFVGNTRMKVTRGEHQEDRVNAGPLHVQ